MNRPRQRRNVLTNDADTTELLETLKRGVVALLSSVDASYSLPSSLTYSIGNGVTNVSWTPPTNAPVSGSTVSFINSYNIRYRLTSNASFTNVVGISSTASTYSVQLLPTENLIVQIRGVNTLLGPFEYAELIITPPPLPTASIITSDNTITDGSSTTITPSFTDGTAQITVNGLSTFGVSPIISDTSYSVTPAVGNTTYNLIVTNGVGAQQSASVIVTVFPVPTASIITSDNTITDGSSTTITPTFTGGTAQITVNGLSTFGVSPIISDTSYSVTPAVGNTTYNLIVTNGAGAQQSASVVITVSPAGPVAPGIFYTGDYSNGVSMLPFYGQQFFGVFASVVRILNFNLTFPIGTTRVRLAGSGATASECLNLDSVNFVPGANQTSQSIELNKSFVSVPQDQSNFDVIYLLLNANNDTNNPDFIFYIVIKG